MSTINVVKASSRSFNEGYDLHVSLIKLYKGYILLVSDHPSYGLGAITLTIPAIDELRETSTSPFNLFGVKHTILSSMIGKVASRKLKEPVLSLLFLTNKTKTPRSFNRSLLLLVNDVLDDYLSSQENEKRGEGK